MGFDSCNRSLKIWESIRTPTPKMGAHLGVWGFIPSHSLTLLGNMKCDSRPSHLACTFTSLCLGHEPKARVATSCIMFCRLLLIHVVYPAFKTNVLKMEQAFQVGYQKGEKALYVSPTN